jgi:outer membrane protein assembly factor BamB
VFKSDWKPEPNGKGLFGWEPVFHPALANEALYVPGAAGTLWKIDKTTGISLAHIDPFNGAASDPANTFVAGPLTADATGNIYYNVLQLSDPSVAEPWQGADSVGAWLVKVDATGTTTMASYASLVPDAPAATATDCPGQFVDEALPWPPTPTASPPTQRCGSQRPGVNVAPAVADDGTIYTVSRAHFDPLVGFVVAVNPDLTPKWQASLQRRLNNGCGALVPIATDTVTPNSCRPGTTPGVDPTTNDLGSGAVVDQSSSSPTALPDGGVLYGTWAQFNTQRGFLFKFDAAGSFSGAYDFGWDSSPAVYRHDGTYSIVIKDNHYDAPLYCFKDDPICQTLPPGPFYITQLDASLNIEWQFQNTTIDSDHPNGYEWCINAPAIDSAGTVYVNSEDGNVYAGSR